ncbi:MAG: GNAT family N-acetyltransferase [Firmicutes bacterium]|nr:GNAT family N-acetyltransferase [Bacillota bacterium]
MIKIESERLLIRDHIPTDIEGLHKLLSDSTTMYYLQDIKSNSFEDSKQNLETAMLESKIANREKYFFGIILRDSQEYVGEIGFTVIEDSPLGKVVNLGYFILKEHWGKGFVTEAGIKVIDYAFRECNVHKIVTGCIKENCNSEKIMKKCNMVKEAEYGKHVWHDGEYKDRVEYGLLREDYHNKI